MRVKGDGIFSINTSASGGFGNAGISLPETVADAGGGGDSPPITDNLGIYFNPDVEVYSDAGTTLAVDGDNIRQFNDQSGNSNTLNQATASAQPIYKDTILGNGNASIQSIGDSMVFTNPLSSSATDSFTFYCAYKPNAVANTFYIMTGASSPYPALYFYTNTHFFRDNSGIPATTTDFTEDTNLKIITLVMNHGDMTYKIYKNSNLEGSRSKPGSFGATDFGKLFANDQLINFGNVLFYTAAHDATQVEEVSDWLNTKYSIY